MTKVLFAAENEMIMGRKTVVIIDGKCFGLRLAQIE